MDITLDQLQQAIRRAADQRQQQVAGSGPDVPTSQDITNRRSPMSMLTADQVTEIAGALEALRNELRTRRWSGARITAVMAPAAGHLVSIAAMRAPVPQQAYFAPPPPYGYGPEDYGQPAQSVPLQTSVTGSTRGELEDRAYQAGLQVFGEGANLVVTLAGTIQDTGTRRDNVTQYQCGALVRVQES